MFRQRSSPADLLAISLGALTLALAAGCSGFAEQSILNQFFTASRLRDNTSLNNITMVSFEPRTQGTVTKFDVVSVTPERRKPLTIRALAQAHQAAKADDAAFMKRREEYQNENLEAIQRVLRADRERTKVKGKDAEVQATWSKFLQDGAAVSRKVAEARRRLAGESALVDLSINGGSNAPVDVAKYDGELLSKDVTIDAQVKLPSGEMAQRKYVVTMERAVLKGDREITGRWIIANIKDAGAPAGKTSELGWFQPRVFGPQRLHAHGREADDELHVAVQGFDAGNGADAELRVSYAHAGTKLEQVGRLIFVLVGVGRGFFARTAAAASVRIRPEVVVGEVALIG
jgi:hypothetical protein